MECIDDMRPGEFNVLSCNSMDFVDYMSTGSELLRRKSSKYCLSTVPDKSNMNGMCR